MKDSIKSAFGQIRADKALIDNTSELLRMGTVKTRRRKGVPLIVRAGALAAAFLLVAGIISHRLYFTAVAHIGIDVNPSVELTLNRFDRVIAEVAFNPEGESLLREVNLRGKAYDNAAGLLLSAARAGGYITRNAQIFMSVHADGPQGERELTDGLMRLMSNNTPIEEAPAGVEVFAVSSEVWEGAHSCHMSAAKYLAIQRLMQADETASLEDYADATVGQIRQRASECENAHAQSGGGMSGRHGQGGAHHGHR